MLVTFVNSNVAIYLLITLLITFVIIMEVILYSVAVLNVGCYIVCMPRIQPWLHLRSFVSAFRGLITHLRKYDVGSFVLTLQLAKYSNISHT